MSFNFSDDDDDDDFDLDAYDDTGLLALASRERAETSASASAFAAAPCRANSGKRAEDDEIDDDDDDDVDSDDGGGDWDDVDWEDADNDDNGGEESARSRTAFPSRGVVIEFGNSRKGRSNDPDENENTQAENQRTTADDGADEDEGGGKRPSSKKRKRTKVLRNVPPETRRLVLDVRRSAMLCDVVRCARRSSFASYRGGGAGGDAIESEGEELRRLLPHAARSLIPLEFHPSEEEEEGKTTTTNVPTRKQLARFTQWLFEFVNRAGERRRASSRRNVAQGAAAASSRRRRQSKGGGGRGGGSKKEDALRATGRLDDEDLSAGGLLKTLVHLSPRYDEDPHLLLEEEGVDAIDAAERISARRKVLLFIAMVRSLRWRARYVSALRPVPLELTVDHPLLASSSFRSRRPLPASSSVESPDDGIRRLLRFVREGGMSKVAARVERRKGRKKAKRREGVAAAASIAIDLAGDDDDDEMSGKEKGDSPKKSSPRAVFPADDSNGGEPLSWAEVLCRNEDDNDALGGQKKASSPSKVRPVARWVPILPQQESFDRPEEVESILAWMEANGSEGRRGEDDDGASGGGGGKRRRRTKWAPKKGPDPRRAKEYARKSPVSYVLAAEHSPSSTFDAPCGGGNGSRGGACCRLTDVTPRYASAWSRTLRLRGAAGRDIAAGGGRCLDEWWETSLKRMNGRRRGPAGRRRGERPSKSPVRSVTKTRTKGGREVDVVELESSDDGKTDGASRPDDGSDSDEDDEVEARELAGNLESEKIPTSKAAFKQSPFYVIPSVLNSRDVLHPDARKRISGVFKGELVYRRSDVSKALRADKWLYRGRRVREAETGRPAKRVKKRKKPEAKGFRALTSYGVSEKAQDDMISSIDREANRGGTETDALYGAWQTDPWSPPRVGPADAIPTNEYRNVELALINPGLAHMDRKGLAPIARKLGVPYAPCMLGYEGRGGERAPTVRGIVVHDHSVALLEEAHAEWESHAAEKEREERKSRILKRWKRLVFGIMTKERLDREYG